MYSTLVAGRAFCPLQLQMDARNFGDYVVVNVNGDDKRIVSDL